MEMFQKLGNNAYTGILNDGKDGLGLPVGTDINRDNRYIFLGSGLQGSREEGWLRLPLDLCRWSFGSLGTNGWGSFLILVHKHKEVCGEMVLDHHDPLNLCWVEHCFPMFKSY